MDKSYADHVVNTDTSAAITKNNKIEKSLRDSNKPKIRM